MGHIKVKPTPFVSAKRNAVAAAAHGSGSSKIDPQKLSSTEGMMRNLAAARAQLEHKLMIDYGKVYFQRIFLESNSYNRGRTIFQPARNEKGSSWDRMKRKMMMKLLTVQTKLLDGAATTPVPFVWATGGDSVAAGHGNFYYQSYTAYLERSVTDIFKAVGMEFTGRNYAMGSTQSALEIALCQKEIFGQDVDVLVWDFGMADGSAVENLWLYLYRAGMNRNRPAFIVNRLGRRYFAQRKRVAEEVEDLGLTTFYASEHVLDRVLASVPDSYGLKDAQLKQLPAFVRNLRCEETIEDGRPDNLCEIEKFNVTVCKDRPYRTSWHSGWYVVMISLLTGRVLRSSLV